MASPYISIIIPIYNAETTLRRCIDSVLGQSFDDFELILVNDGSKDSSGKICDEYALYDHRIKVLHKENGGVSIARNLGISKATGKWITFIDADDWIESDFLMSVNGIEDSKTDWILAEWRTLWDKVKEEELHDYQKTETICGQKEIDKSWNILTNEDICRCPWGKFFKRSIIADNGITFDQTLRFGEDTVFNYQYLLRCKSISLSKRDNAHYVFYQVYGNKAVKKYKCSAQSIITARDKIFDIYFNRGYNNQKFERLFLFGYTMIEHIYLDKADDDIRKGYYQGKNQLALERRNFNTIKFYDRMMYWMFKNLPHVWVRPLAKYYLRYR